MDRLEEKLAKQEAMIIIERSLEDAIEERDDSVVMVIGAGRFRPTAQVNFSPRTYGKEDPALQGDKWYQMFLKELAENLERLQREDPRALDYETHIRRGGLCEVCEEYDLELLHGLEQRFQGKVKYAGHFISSSSQGECVYQIILEVENVARADLLASARELMAKQVEKYWIPDSNHKL